MRERPIWNGAFLRDLAAGWRRRGRGVAIALSVILLAQFQPTASRFSDLKSFAPANAQIPGIFQPVLLSQGLTCTGYSSTTTTATYRLYKFTASGTLTCVGGSVTGQYLVVAAGAGTAGRGGGAAGGYLFGTTALAAGTYSITVGTGTTGNGNNSVLGSIATATGGGTGGTTANTNGQSGGSGGGGAVGTGVGGAASPAGQGNAGGNGGAFSGNFSSGGGGGCTAAGQAGQAGGGGSGGDGCTWSVDGNKYACGGGGHADTGSAGPAGCSSAGAGAIGYAAGGAPTANTGSGAGGGNPPLTQTGASGIVIVAVPL